MSYPKSSFASPLNAAPVSLPTLLAVFLLSGALMVSCVTVNIYFPAAAAEKAADRIIDQVWGEKGSKDGRNVKGAGSGAGASQTEQQSSAQGALNPALINPLERAAVAVLDFVIPVAHAQANLNISTPAIKRLQSAMTARHGRLKPFYDSGAIGLTVKGLIAARELGAVSLRERGKLKRMVGDENADRNALYREIARANNHPEWESQIRATFAQRWVSRAHGGWWYQGSGGSWKQK